MCIALVCNKNHAAEILYNMWSTISPLLKMEAAKGFNLFENLLLLSFIAVKFCHKYFPCLFCMEAADCSENQVCTYIHHCECLILAQKDIYKIQHPQKVTCMNRAYFKF